MYVSQGSALSEEFQDIAIADAALTIGFALALSGGIFGLTLGGFLYLLPMAFLAVTLSFVLHELMHKFVAQHFGAVAAFKKSDNGILITLVTSTFGFLIGMVGATVIYASHFTREEEGYVSLAGPLTNFIVFAVAFGLLITFFHSFSQNALNLSTTSPYLKNALGMVAFISIYLAFFNMLPIYPLDGSKVLRWNMPVYVVSMAVIFVLLYSVVGPTLIPSLIIILILAYVMSTLSRAILF